MKRKALNYHYKKIEELVSKQDPSAYDHAWLFAKKIIQYAHKLPDEETQANYLNSSYSIDIVNKYIADAKVRNALHEIRLVRNDYQHKSLDKTIKNADYNKLLDTIRNLIMELNRTPGGVRYKYESEVSGIEFTYEGKQRKNLKYAIRLPPRRPSNMGAEMYTVSYGDSDAVFQVQGKLLSRTSASVHAVIHNILIRSKTIKESSYLIKQNLARRDLELVYIYEILILRAICSGLCNQVDIISVPSEHVSFAAIAVSDIDYYYGIIDKMSRTQNIYNVKVESIEVSGEQICPQISNKSGCLKAEIIDEYSSEVWAPSIIGKRINYFITHENIGYYNLLLSEIFGFDQFKEGQLSTLKSILESTEHFIVVLPTGYGKSLIYQFLALVQPLVSIVVSPTRALIHDQLETLKDLGVSRIGLFERENIKISHNDIIISASGIEMYATMYYATPSDIQSQNLFALLRQLSESQCLGYIAIDECHQMSVWGHRFEAEYFTLIHQLKEELPNTQFLLFSATSSTRVKEDLKSQFGGSKALILQPCALERMHIKYQFIELNSIEAIIQDIVDRFNRSYCKGDLFDISSSRFEPSLSLIINNNDNILKKIFEIFSSSPNLSDSCIRYRGEKTVYNRFRMANKRIVLTDDKYLAGINVPFLRNVIIIGCPPSKEWLYQESGRVGRFGESSNVLVYTISSQNDEIRAIINDDYSKFKSGVAKDKFGRDVDVSNLDSLASFHISEMHLSQTIKIFEDIKNCVRVSSGDKFGIVSGKMKETEKHIYDFPLFIMHITHIVSKWLFKDSSINYLSYRFNINMEIDNGTLVFENKLVDFIRAQSGSNHISTSYTKRVSNINDDFHEMFRVASDWFSENCFYIKQQMFINTYQMVKDGVSRTDEYLESALCSYFGTSADFKQPLSTNEAILSPVDLGSLLNRDYTKIIISSFSEKTSITEVSNDIKKTNNYESTGDLKFLQDTTGAEKTEHDNHNSLEVRTLNQISKSDQLNKLDTKQSILPKVVQNELEQSEDEYYLLHGLKTVQQVVKLCKSSDFYSINLVTQIIDFAIIAQNSSDLHHLRSAFERELEYFYNANLDVSLALFEILFDSKPKLFRIGNIIKRFSTVEKTQLFELVFPFLSCHRKRQIDNILNEYGEKRFFYNGFFGSLKYYLQSLMYGRG